MKQLSQLFLIKNVGILTEVLLLQSDIGSLCRWIGINQLIMEFPHPHICSETADNKLQGLLWVWTDHQHHLEQANVHQEVIFIDGIVHPRQLCDEQA